jgi:hypothetical protein
MYPTEGDFANVFESYVHKDDDISMSKVVLTDGDGNTTTLNNVIGNKADKTDLTEITNRLTTAENDIDTAEDNIAGHETRIQSLEAFKERVRAFLEDADASEETINRWHEIESFLQGITDTQTLTGLLADLKQEILASIPEPQTGNYLKLVPDLDAYTDAPDGEIVKYTGSTTDKYTHGWDYERKAGSSTTAQIFTLPKPIVSSDGNISFSGSFVATGETVSTPVPYVYGSTISYYNKESLTFLSTDENSLKAHIFGRNIGDLVEFDNVLYPIVGYFDYFMEDQSTFVPTWVDTINDNVVIDLGDRYVCIPTTVSGYNLQMDVYANEQGQKIAVNILHDDFVGWYKARIGLYVNDALACYALSNCEFTNPISTGATTTPASWQLCHSMPVIQ